MLRRSDRNATGCKGRRGINRSAALWALCRHRHKAHWVCGPKRLDTQKVNCNKREYAFNELVAEIGACFLGVQLGVEPDFDQSAAYVKSWLRALKDDKDLIFKAAAEAQKAVDHINATIAATSSVSHAAA